MLPDRFVVVDRLAYTPISSLINPLCRRLYPARKLTDQMGEMGQTSGKSAINHLERPQDGGAAPAIPWAELETFASSNPI